MIGFTESNFYKALQDFFNNNNKDTFLQMLSEFYNRTEDIIDKNNIQDDLIKELRELYLEFNEKGIDENIVREKVNYFLEYNVKIKDIISKLVINTNKIKDNTEKLNINTNNIKNINSQLETKANKEETKNIQQQVNNLVLGAVGDGNNAEVIQARGEYETLNSRLEDNFFNKWSGIFPSWNDGYFINTKGQKVELTGYSVSNNINVENYKKIQLRNVKGNNQLSIVTFYSSDNEVLNTNVVSSDEKIYEVEIPYNALSFVLCKNNNKEFSVYFDKEENDNNFIELTDNITWTNGYYIDNNGAFKANDSFKYSNLIKVDKGIIIKGMTKIENYPNIAFYDENNNYVTGIKNINYYELNEIENPITHFRICINNHYNNPSIQLNIKNSYKYSFTETTLVDNENCEINTPKYIDSVINTETTIYVDNLLLSENSTFDINFKYNLVDNGIQFTPTNEGKLYLKIQERDDKFNLINETNPIIRVVSSTNNNTELKNILIIGDSLIDNSYVAKETYRLLTESGATFNQLGTRGPLDGKHEGHGGWSWEDYFKETYDGKPNAFYNNGGLDFKNYCNVNGYSGIDYCIIALGTNDVRQGNTTSTYFTDSYIASIIENAKKFINKLLADYPNCKIAIGLPSVGADLITKNSKAFQYKMKKLLTAYIKTFDNGVYHQNVTTVANGLFINRRLGYQTTNKNVSKRFINNSVNVITDYIHSNPNGYYCYSDCFYAKIRSWMSGNL